MSQDGGKRFGRYTEANVGNRLAVVLDNQTISVATIQSKIEDSGRITNLGERAGGVEPGAVPEVRFAAGGDRVPRGAVGGPVAGRGFDSGRVWSPGWPGWRWSSSCWFYYKRSGVNAVLALVLNTVILVAALSYFHAVLTLPGIAGVILTIGMAVDSNVLIFERIREELRAGKGVIAAVDAGFGKAWWTIVDTHVTTIVSCAFLFMFGTGPVRGFAVTLVIGLFANVFTAVFVSKVIFDFELSRSRQVTALSI